MFYIQKPRKTGKNLAACISIGISLDQGKSCFIATQSYPQTHINILKSLGYDVIAEATYTTPKPEPIYDNLFDVEPQIIGYKHKEKELYGYYIKLKPA